MAMKTINHLNSRKFINKSRGLGAMECQVETTYYSKDDPVIDASVSIQDCNRSIHLEFGVYEKKDVAAKLSKINLMIEELLRFKAAFTTATDAFVEQPKTKKKPAVIKIPK
jgi:hypothetical protein